jgi:translation elongation factor P/translation initiation factor 5A
MKRKKTTTKRRKSNLPVLRKTSMRRRKRTKGMSEIFSSATASAGAKVIGAGALGGLIGGFANKILQKQMPITRYGLEIGASFITYALLGYPSMSAGMAGAFTALETQTLTGKFLNDDDMFADDNSLNELPEMLNENGESMTMLQDDEGNVAFMNEDTGEMTMAEDVTFLQDEQTFLQENEGIYLQDDMQTYLQDEPASIYPNYSVQYS